MTQPPVCQKELKGPIIDRGSANRECGSARTSREEGGGRREGRNIEPASAIYMGLPGASVHRFPNGESMRPVYAGLLVTVSVAACSGDGTGNVAGPTIQIAGTWSTASPIPQAVQEISAAVLDGRIYIAGGIDSNGRTSISAFRYDPSTDSWEQIADLPAGRHHMPLAAVNDTIYAIGGLTTTGSGFVAQDNLWIYDAGTDQWAARTALPQPRGAGAAGVVDGHIVVAGGYDDNVQLLDSVVIYDPASNSWRAGAPILTPRDHLAGGVVNGVFYLIGGRRVTATSTLVTVEAYDLVTDSWTALANMPTSRGGLAAGVVGQQIFVFGGEPDQSMFIANEAYDVTSDIWALAPRMPTGRHGLGVVAVGNAVFTIGGGTVGGLGATSTVEVFTPLP